LLTDRPARSLTHDFGVVRPRQTSQCRFTLHNDSAKPWTLARMHNSCSCLATRPAADTFAPGQDLLVDVDYTSPEANQDDRRRIGVEFAEETAPLVWLEVLSCVRQPITVFPAELVLVPTDRSRPIRAILEIRNCTDQDIRLLAVLASAAWLTTGSPTSRPVGAEHDRARQVWELPVEARVAGLATGEHHAQVEIQSDCPLELRKTIGVQLGLRPLVSASPGYLAFGDVASGSPVSRKLLVRSLPDANADTFGDLVLRHDLGDALHLEWTRVSPDTWQITATLAIPSKQTGEEMRGQITVAFANNDLVPLQVPVSACPLQP
jgi:hypothetical protein